MTPAWSCRVRTMVPASQQETPTSVTVLRGFQANTVRQVRQMPNHLFTRHWQNHPNNNTFRFNFTNVCWFVWSLLFSSEAEDFLKCLYQNGQCQHFCDGSGESRKCFCAHGYKLASDGRQCIAQGTNMISSHVNHWCIFRYQNVKISNKGDSLCS